MGNICGKESKSDNFSQPGRVLGEAPAPGPKSARVPKKVGGPPRKLGGSSSEAPGDAAEARAGGKGKGGKLQSQLTAQKQKSRSDTLRDVSRQAVQEREAAAQAQARNWD